MVKVHAIVRDRSQYSRDRKSDLRKVQRNFDPKLHPFERQVEYTRALNAVKLDKVFAKPFVGALSGHSDAIHCIARHPYNLACLVSGAFDGEIRVWSLTQRKTVHRIGKAHEGVIRGLIVCPDGKHIMSCGDDRTVKQFSLNFDRHLTEDIESISNFDSFGSVPIVKEWSGSSSFSDLDHQRNSTQFGTSGPRVEVWDYNRSSPIQSYEWGTDTAVSLKFNPVEVNVLASSATDRSIALYDIRSASPLRKIILSMRTNSIAWNPMEVFNFTVANEDYNCYTFDMRKLDQALMVHKDHVGAVLDIEYSPTGAEFVTGSYDRTVRIFRRDEGRSRTVYHTKRMQRIFSVRFSQDSKFVFSGSDDTNVRIWKAEASVPLRPMARREKRSLDYKNKLKERFANVPELKRIARHQHVPKVIKRVGEVRRIMENSAKRKKENVAKHSAEKSKPTPARQGMIIKQLE